MTGTDLYKRTHKSVPVIFEPPCISSWYTWLKLMVHCSRTLQCNVMEWHCHR